MKFTEVLLKQRALIFYEGEDNVPHKHLDRSPFFQAIVQQCQWAIELFCDHGADVNTQTSSGQSPLIYAASNNYDDICMYLSLRVEDVNTEDENTGLNTFVLYLLKEDLNRA